MNPHELSRQIIFVLEESILVQDSVLGKAWSEIGDGERADRLAEWEKLFKEVLAAEIRRKCAAFATVGEASAFSEGMLACLRGIFGEGADIRTSSTTLPVITGDGGGQALPSFNPEENTSPPGSSLEEPDQAPCNAVLKAGLAFFAAARLYATKKRRRMNTSDLGDPEVVHEAEVAGEVFLASDDNLREIEAYTGWMASICASQRRESARVKE